MVDRRYMDLCETETNRETSTGEQIINHRLVIGTEKGVPYLIKKLTQAEEDGTLEALCMSWRDAAGWR